ncbi:MAG: peptidase [Frankiales bacterium]|nr:peptidase [Frankiales bacterium]
MAATGPQPPPLAYSTVSRTQHYALYTVRGGSQRQLVSSTHAVSLDAWSTTGEIYYTVPQLTCPTDCHSRVDEVPDQGGSPQTVVASGAQLSIDHFGKTVVYVDGGQLWRRALTGTSATRLTGAGGTAPVISPDGRSVLFSRQVEGPGALVMAVFVMPLAGGAPRRITGGSTLDLAGAWSPDSRRVLFTRDAVSARPKVMSVYVDGTGLRLVAADAHDPAWADDGWVAYLARRGDDQTVAVGRPPGGAERELARVAGSDVTGVRFEAGG